MFAVLITAFLAFAFWYGGDAPGLRGWVSTEKSDSISTYDVSKGYNTEKTGNDAESDTDNVSDIPVTEQNVEQEKTETDEKEHIIVNEDSDGQDIITEDVASEDNCNDDIPISVGDAQAEEFVAATEDDIRESVEEAEKEPTSHDEDMTYPEPEENRIDEDTGKDKYLTEPIPDGKPLPIEPQDAVISDKKLTCTLSVRCDTINLYSDWLDSEKLELVPRDGIIYAEKTVSFYEGESVFNLLVREMKQNRIHMEFENVPIYNSAYIEGIGNLYEFDCGELSGWMYRVNGWFPNYGCSRYALKPGDRVEWLFTCDSGADIGGDFASGGNRRAPKDTE